MLGINDIYSRHEVDAYNLKIYGKFDHAYCNPHHYHHYNRWITIVIVWSHTMNMFEAHMWSFDLIAHMINNSYLYFKNSCTLLIFNLSVVMDKTYIITILLILHARKHY